MGTASPDSLPSLYAVSIRSLRAWFSHRLTNPRNLKGLEIPENRHHSVYGSNR